MSMRVVSAYFKFNSIIYFIFSISRFKTALTDVLHRNLSNTKISTPTTKLLFEPNLTLNLQNDFDLQGLIFCSTPTPDSLQTLDSFESDPDSAILVATYWERDRALQPFVLHCFA